MGGLTGESGDLPSPHPFPFRRLPFDQLHDSLFLRVRSPDPAALGPPERKRAPARPGEEDLPGLHLVTYLFAAELLSLFLFIFTADRIHGFFVGAMCAAGTLKANGFGYPALLLKSLNGLLAGLWLVLNWADNKGYDYPLIKTKYAWLLAAAPLVLAETVLQANFFLRLKPDIVTSCCGSLFSLDGGSLASDLASLPPTPMRYIFFLQPFSLSGPGACFL